MLVAEDERRPDLEHVSVFPVRPMRTPCSRSASTTRSPVAARRAGRRREGPAAHLDDRPARRARRRPQQHARRRAHALEEALVLDHVEHGERRPAARPGCRRRCEERPSANGNRSTISRRGDHGRDRVAVAHRLAERHDVGRDAVAGERPEVLAACGRGRPAPRRRRKPARRRASARTTAASSSASRDVDAVARERPVDERRGEPVDRSASARPAAAATCCAAPGGGIRATCAGTERRGPFLRREVGDRRR